MTTIQATVLAFDLGASSGRALIGKLLGKDGETLKLVVQEVHRFPNHAVEVGNHLHWDILRLHDEIKTGIRAAFRAGYTPQSLGIDTWGVDFGLFDRNGELLGNPYHYRDPQTSGLIEEVESLIGREQLYARGGLQFMPFNTIYQLYAMKKADSPKLNAAETLLLTPDLLAYFLTGVKSCEYTMATTTQLFDPGTQAWNKDWMELLGIPSRIFLQPVRPGSRIGALTPEVCAELGVPPIDIVAVATHDTESAVAAVPTQEPSFAYLVCGTWSLLGTEIYRPLLTAEALELSFSNEGGAGGTYQLLKNIMGLWLLQECVRDWEGQGRKYSYPELIQLAESAEPFRCLINPDNSLFYSPHEMPHKIMAYCRNTGQPEPRNEGEFVRCILESLALKYCQALEQAEQLTGRRFTGLHMVGGGIQNELLCQLTADAIGRPVWAGPAEASAIGNMLLQFISLGICRDLKEARNLVSESFPVQTFMPGESTAWNEALKTFEGLS